MSNYEFLITDAKQIEKYSWFTMLYKEAKAVEYDYVAGEFNCMFRDSRIALEFATKKYMFESGKTIKKQTILSRNKHKKAERKNNSKPVKLTTQEDAILLDIINAVQPPGQLLPAAHFIRKEGNDAQHNIEYVGTGREYDCLKNLHDFILWIYNELTEAEAVSEFSLDNLDERIQFTERERLQDALKETSERRVSKRKKKIKKSKKAGYRIETHKNEIIIVNDKEEELFIFQDSQKDETIVEKQLPAVMEHMKYMLMEVKQQKNSLVCQVREYEQENQCALSEIQLYINELNLGEKNAQVLIEDFTFIQKEQHEALEEVIRRMEEKLRDKESCIQFLEQLSQEQNVQMDILKLRIVNLEQNISEFLDELNNFQKQEKPQLLSQWIQQVKGNFHKDKAEEEKTYSREQFEHLYKNFKQQFHCVNFLYESERMIRQKQDFELSECQFKLGEQKNINKKLMENIEGQKIVFEKYRKKQKFKMRLMRYFCLILSILIIILVIYWRHMS